MDLIWSMRLFVRIVELNSFQRAARETGLGKAAATRSMAQLEAHLGAKLLLRTTRSFQLTTCGSRYLEGCRAWLDQLDALDETALQSDRMRGDLQIVSTMGESNRTVAHSLQRFRNDCPQVAIEYSILEHKADIHHCNFDVAILPGLLKPGSGYIVHTVTDKPLICVASPQYLRRKGVPETPEDLLNHTYVSPSSVPDGGWYFQSANRNFEICNLTTAFIANGPSDALDAVLDGDGFTMGAPDEFCDKLHTGQLHHVLPEYTVSSAETAISLIVPKTKAAWTSVSRFVGLTDELAQKIRREAWANVKESSYE